MNSFINRSQVALCKLVARLPFWAIYALSDLIYFVLYHLVGYRRKVVHENLTRSFPEKSLDEIRMIEKKFYRHLSDVSMESLKYGNMTEKQLDERLKVNNLDMYDEYYSKGQSIIVLAMHYNNWEWPSAMQRILKAQFTFVYNPMRTNTEFERFMLDARERFGAKSVPINHSVRTALAFGQNVRPSGLVLVADQTAPAYSQFWTMFLNQETAFFTGPMKIAVKTNLPVILLHSRKTGRGHYEISHYRLVEKPAETKPEEIMMAYIRKMEEIIKAEPEYWLWSHRRWKHKRPENTPLYEQ